MAEVCPVPAETRDLKMPASADDRVKFLNRLIHELFHYSALPKAERPTHIGKLLFVDTPEGADTIFRNHTIFGKNFALIAAIGQSRFNTNDAEWMNLRDRTQRHYAQAGRPRNLEFIRAWDRAEIQTIDVTDNASIERAFLTAALKVFFSALGLKPDVKVFFPHFQELRQLFVDLQYYSWVGIPSDIERKKLAARLNNAREAFWESCQGQPGVCDFILSGLDNSNPQVTTDAVTDLMTNMFAGIETTSATLCWFLDAIGRNPDVLARCRESLDATTEGPDYIDLFLKETMRCFPPIPFVTREALEETSYNGQLAQPGTQFLVSIVGIHRSEETWSRAQEFLSARPEFMKNGSPPSAFRPFLSGPRMCGGRRLAELELSVATQEIIRQFDIRNDSQKTDFSYALALRPNLSPGLKLERRT